MLTLLGLFLFPLILLLGKKSAYWWNMMWAQMIMCLISLLLVFSPMGVEKTCLSLQADATASLLILLSCFISTLMVLNSDPSNKSKLFCSTVFILNIFIILTFLQSNLIYLYIFFEASLVPTLFLILIWGYQPERLQAGLYMVMYTLGASLPLLVSILFLFIFNGHLNMNLLLEPNLFNSGDRFVGWGLLILAFLVKLPLFMVHLWLPKAHVEAPVAGSMILAALLLKLGGYGIFRLIFIFPKLSLLMNSYVAVIALVGGTLTSLICIRQTDMKSLIAYSSIGHMGLMLAGLLTNTMWGMTMGVLMMVAHGLCSSGLFSLANLLYEKMQSRSLFICKGALSITPSLALWWFLFSALNMAAPPSINLLSELGLIASILTFSLSLLIPLIFMSFLTAAYSLILYTTTQHGPLPNFMNPLMGYSCKSFSIIFFHWFPAQALILSPNSFML